MAGWRGPDPVENVSQVQLRALQLERARASVQLAYDKVPLYKEKFDAAGVGPDDLKSLDDLQRFPFTTKDDLRKAYPFGLFAVPKDEIVRVHASSGTTGKPTVVGYNAADIEMWSGLMARSLWALGIRPQHKIHSSFGYGLFTGGMGWHYGGEKLGAMMVPASGGFTERHVQLIHDFEPDVLLATPSYALVIADAFKSAGFDPAKSSVRTLIAGAEPWSEALRAEIEQCWGVDAYDSYGLSEVIGPGVAQECMGDKGALTIWEDHFLPEIVDPGSGDRLEEGEKGEVVFTSLTKQAMPVIRYRTRDVTRLLPPKDRSMRRLERISGRTDDMLIIRGVNLFPTQIEAILAPVDQLSTHYQLEVFRGDKRMDELIVHIETKNHADASGGAAKELGARTRHMIKAHSGVNVQVEILAPETIERSQGKAKRIIDRRPKQ